MKILMFSGDNSILDPISEAHARQLAYTRVCGELHIVVLCRDVVRKNSYGNLFLYPARGNKIMQRIRALTIGRAILKQADISIITSQAPDELGLIGYILGWLFFVPMQLQVHTDILSPWFRRAGFGARLKYILARFLLPRASCIRVVSRRIAESLTRELGIAPSAITILPIFTDVEKFMQKELHKAIAPHFRDADYAVLAVGRFVDKEKNFSMLIRAMRRVITTYPKTALCIIGDGPDKSYYESLIAALGLKEHVFLELWRKDLAAVYPSFDVLALPSYIEGWGRAVIEAMASGLAIVMTDVGVAREVIQNNVNGVIVSVNDEQAFADALIALCRNPELRMKYAFAAKESACNLTLKTREEYIALWRESFERCGRKNN